MVKWRQVQYMSKAAFWIRVGTGHQVTDNQVPDLERFAAHHGYDIVDRYELTESAWSGGKDSGEYRAALQRALDAAWQGKFNVLIVCRNSYRNRSQCGFREPTPGTVAGRRTGGRSPQGGGRIGSPRTALRFRLPRSPLQVVEPPP
jgi:Resolvase, N terminal domain